MNPPQSVRTARLAVSTSFFVSGAVLASWVPHIPGMQRALGLSPGVLGLVLLAPAIGSVIAMLISGGLCARWGHARVNRLATIIYCCAVPLTVVAPHPFLLGGILVVMGLNNGTLGVAMNAEAIEVERAYQRGINSSFHALYGLGLLVGASVGSLVGFGLVGLGMANVIPNFFSYSVRERSLPPSRAIAAVSSLGYAGILMGPPIIGAVAQFTSLPAAMGVVALCSSLVWALAGTLSPRPPYAAPSEAGSAVRWRLDSR